MSDDSLDTCGCCKRVPCACTPGTTAPNRPGLPALRYRIGTHATFLQAMIDAIPGKVVEEAGDAQRPLAPLTARGDDDPAIALFDATAVVCDVLAFYQERIANEGFLRTATERRSVLELAREIGYELAPGVAASTYLAFSVEDAPSAPKQAVVPVGTKIQSVPGPGEQPQIFETTAAQTVRAEWNALPALQTHLQQLVIDGGALTVDGVFVDEIYLAGTGLNLKEGDPLLVVQGNQALAVRMRRIVEDGVNARTRVELGPRWTLPRVPAPVDPDPWPTETNIPQTLATVQQYIVERTWAEEDLQAFLVANKWDAAVMLTQVQTLLASQVPSAKVYAFKQKVGFFGATAPLWLSLLRDGVAPAGFPKNWDDWNETNAPISIWRDGITPLVGYEREVIR